MLIRGTSCLLLIICLSACASKLPEDALRLPETSLEQRSLQTRVYEDVTEEVILSASVAILQDLGAKITETESELGLVVGEKMRDASDTGEFVAAVFLGLLFGDIPPVDDKQKIKFSLVTSPVSKNEDNTSWRVRLTVQRLVWNTENQLSRIEAVTDQDIYQGFFEKLDKALFLEEQL